VPATWTGMGAAAAFPVSVPSMVPSTAGGSPPLAVPRAVMRRSRTAPDGSASTAVVQARSRDGPAARETRTGPVALASTRAGTSSRTPAPRSQASRRTVPSFSRPGSVPSNTASAVTRPVSPEPARTPWRRRSSRSMPPARRRPRTASPARRISAWPRPPRRARSTRVVASAFPAPSYVIWPLPSSTGQPITRARSVARRTSARTAAWGPRSVPSIRMVPREGAIRAGPSSSSRATSPPRRRSNSGDQRLPRRPDARSRERTSPASSDRRSATRSGDTATWTDSGPRGTAGDRCQVPPGDCSSSAPPPRPPWRVTSRKTMSPASAGSR
jgi:hypothetical protein